MRIGKIIFGIILLALPTMVHTSPMIKAEDNPGFKTIWHANEFEVVYKNKNLMLIRRPGKGYLKSYNHDLIWLGNGCSVWFNKNNRLKTFMDSSNFGTDFPIYTFNENLVIVTKNDFTSCFDLKSGRFLWQNKMLGNVSKIIIGKDRTACTIYDIVYRKLSLKLIRFNLDDGEIIDETPINLDEPKEKSITYFISLVEMYENFVFFGIDNEIHCYNLNSEKETWRCSYAQPYHNGICFADGIMIFFNKNTYGNCDDYYLTGTIIAIEIKSGKSLWTSVANWNFDVQGNDVYYSKTQCNDDNVNQIIRQNAETGEMIDKYLINQTPGLYELHFEKDYIFTFYFKQRYDINENANFLIIDRNMKLIFDEKIKDSFLKDHNIRYFDNTFLILRDYLKESTEKNMSLVTLPNYISPNPSELLRLIFDGLRGNP